MAPKALCCIFIFVSLRLVMAQSRPNIVIFLADDMGIGDIGPYGNTTLQTPNIDSLARDGMKLTQHLAAENLCTPSRSALLTGRYTRRYGMDGGAIRVLLTLACPTGLPTTEITFAEQAKAAGYKTALVGKWHLGLYDMLRNPVYHPNNRGFDYFYGLPLTLSLDQGGEQSTMTEFFPQTTRNFIIIICATWFTLVFLLMKNLIRLKLFVILLLISAIVFLYGYINLYYSLYISSQILMKNFEIVEMPLRLVGLTERLAREGVEFIKNQTLSNSPFLLFVSWGHTHTFLAPNRKFAGHSHHGRYGDCVEELDWGTGLVLKALDDAGVRDDTLVYFTSDHGGSLFDFGAKGQNDGGYNGIYRGGKGIGGVDGGIRVPGLFRWPGVIKPGSVSDVVTTQLDIFPLISALTNSPLPQDREIDGKDILPVLKGEQTDSLYDYVYHYCDGVIVAVRYMPRGETTVWKLVYRAPSLNLNDPYSLNAFWCTDYPHFDSPLLFNMTSDPGENQPVNIESEPKYKEIVATINEATENHRNSIPEVENRLTLAKIIWYPHLQPFCNFPRLTCVDEKYRDEDIN